MDPVKNAISCTPEASSSAAAAALSSSGYDAFLSFRGEDTRKNFTSHLYSALTQAGIRTFLDSKNIRKGENISAEIREAIQESRISVVVFSKHYASSRWCLDELAQIMKRKRSDDKHVVIPVFYDVDPSHVRNQTGTYETAFATHEKRFRTAIEKVNGWRAVLRQVADLSGMPLQDGHEAEFIKEIVMHIKKKLEPQVLNVTPFVLGREDIVEKINLWLHNSSNKVDIAMIYGIGGIGKTELAKIVYNQNHHKFNASSFLANIREASCEQRGLVKLQKQLLSDLLNGEKVKIHNVDEGTTQIRMAVRNRRVFIVLDDVDDTDVYESIIGMGGWFYDGSKIVITTRYKELVRDTDNCKKFEVVGLSNVESMELLSWHAFRQDYPLEGYMRCSESILEHCAGLPLALKVLGSSLKDKSSEIWEDRSKKLENVFDSKIHKVLRISYDGLNDDHDKNLFLDIACFFVGKKKEYVLKILEGCEYFAKTGVQNLVDNCFLFFDGKSKIEMHQLLRDMGREIVRQKGQKKDPSRIWQDKYALDVLMNKSGTSSIRGLSLDMRKLKDSERSTIETKSFQMMRNLKLLRINHVKLIGGYREFPKSLVWLCWDGYPLESLPTDLCLEKLVVLEMCNSKLKHNWKRGKLLKELEFLDLSNCLGFVNSPDFTGLSNLQRLVLKECLNLVDINDSIECLTKLMVLNLKGCKKLQNISSKICCITTLKKLILSNCSKLKVLPPGFDKMGSLKFLYMDGTAIGGSESFTPWFSHWLFRAPKSRSFSMGDLPRFLVELKLHECNLFNIDFDFQNMPCLEALSLGGNLFNELPESISSLSHLQELALINCQSLKCIPNLPQNYMIVEVRYCPELVKIDWWLELRPMSKADVELINSLGLYALEADEVLQLSMEYMINGIRKRAPIQVLHDSFVSSVFLPSADIPSWYRYCGDTKTEFIGPSGSYLWYSATNLLVPLQVGRKLVGFNICIVYEAYPIATWKGPGTIRIRFGNEDVEYNPKFYAVPESGTDMLWLSQWRFYWMSQPNCHVTIFFHANVKRWGVDPIYEPDNQMVRLSDFGLRLNPWNSVILDRNLYMPTATGFAPTEQNCDFSKYVWSNGRLKLVNPMVNIHPSQTQNPSLGLTESRNIQNLCDQGIYSTVIGHSGTDDREWYWIYRPKTNLRGKWAGHGKNMWNYARS